MTPERLESVAFGLGLGILPGVATGASLSLLAGAPVEFWATMACIFSGACWIALLDRRTTDRFR